VTLKSEILSDVSGVIFDTDDFAESASVSRNSVTVTLSVIMDTQEVKTRENVSSRSADVEVSRNWVVLLVQASLYDFGGGAVEPSTTDSFSIDSRKFEPRRPDGMGQCWEYTDGTSQIFMIYVEEV